jgi:hypothetical protein
MHVIDVRWVLSNSNGHHNNNEKKDYRIKSRATYLNSVCKKKPSLDTVIKFQI